MKHRFLTLLFALTVSICAGFAQSFTGFEVYEGDLGTQIKEQGLIYDTINTTLVQSSSDGPKYNINLVAAGEGTFKIGGITFYHKNSSAGNTAFKTQKTYIQPNGKDREIRIPTVDGEIVNVRLTEACAGVLVNGVLTDLAEGDNELIATGDSIVLKTASTKPKISAILSTGMLTQYTVIFYPPYLCEGSVPAVMGDFNNWTILPMHDTVYYGENAYTASFKAKPGTYINYCDTLGNKLMRKRYGEWTEYSNQSLSSWYYQVEAYCNDKFTYRFQNCSLPPMHSATATVLVPSDCNMPITDGLYICWWGTNNTETKHIEKMTDKGGRVYSITFNPNDESYGYYFMNMNAANEGVQGFKRTYENNQMTNDSLCWEIGYQSMNDPWYYHNLNVDDYCALKDHNYFPTNLKATNTALDTVVFTWEVSEDVAGYQLRLYDDAGEQYHYQYIYASSVPDKKFTWSFKNTEPVHVSYWTLEARNQNYEYYAAKGEGFTIAGDGRIPHNLTIEAKGNDQYTLHWESTGEVHHFHIEDGMSAGYDTTALEYTLTLEPNGYYTLSVYAMTADDNTIGAADISLTTTTQTARDITIYFYLPQLEKFNTGKGYAMVWRDAQLAGDHVVPLVAVDGGGNRFKAVVPQYTRDAIRIKLVNDSTGAAPTETIDNQYEIYNDQYYTTSRDDKDKAILTTSNAQGYFEVGKDVAITSVQATQNLNQMRFSWTANDKAQYYRVRIYNANGSTAMDRSVEDTFYTYDFNNADTLQLTWSVTPSQYYWSEYYGLTTKSTCTVAPSPFLPKNLKAVNNNDGTFTFSWSPAEHDTVKMYSVYIYDAQGSYIANQNDIKKTSVTMPVQLLFSGKYTMQVTSMTQRYYSLGEAVDTFEVAPTTPHPITIRVMMNPTANYDTSEGLKFRINYTMDSTKLVDAVQEKYGWWSYQLTTDQYGIRMSLENGWSTVQIYGDTCLQYNGDFREVDCDARSTDYIPHHLKAIANGDGTYMLTWMMDRTEDVREYRIDVQHSDSNWYYNTSVQELQCKTPLLPYSGKYAFTVRVYDRNWNSIGRTIDTLEVAPLPERTIKLRVLEQPIEQGWTGFQLDAFWNETALNIQDELENEQATGWCFAEVTTTQPAVHIKLQSIWGEESDFWMTADTCLHVNNGFVPVACDAKMPTYKISNPHIESKGNGVVTYTWECTESPDRFYIRTYLPDSVLVAANFVDGQERSFTTSFNVDSVVEVSWNIVSIMSRNGGNYNLGGMWGDTTSVEPSKYAPQNLQATSNRDGSYTVSWNSQPDTVAYFNVEIAKPTGGRDAFRVEDTTFVTPVLKDLGRHIIYVYSKDKDDKTLGWQATQVVVDTLDTPRDITVRVLLHPDTERDNPGYMQVYRLYDDPTYGSYEDWEYIPYNDLGNNWYSYTFSSSMPAQLIRLINSELTVAFDTCLEYYSNNLRVADCDAVAHDYRITDGSLKAVSEPGKVTFTWSAKEKSDEYRIEGRYMGEYGYEYYAFYTNVTDTSYVYMVPDNMDSVTLSWAVRPLYPRSLNSKYGDDVMLMKSQILFSDLKVTSTDSVNYRFSWACNNDTVQYEVEINQMRSEYWAIHKAQTDTTLFDYTFVSSDPTYGWRVRAVNAKGEPLSAWVADTVDINVKRGMKAITNLKGSVQGNVLTFTWDSKTPVTSGHLYCSTQEMGWIDILGRDTMITGNTFSYAATIDGRYEFIVQPYVEYTKDDYRQLQERTWVQTNMFTTPTFKLTVQVTEGGMLWDDPSGNYPDGYEVWVDAGELTGYRFVAWSDGVTEINRLMKITSDTTITAYFEVRKMHNLTVNATEGGKLEWWDDEGNNKQGTTYQGTLGEGNSFWVTAEPAEGYTFYQWSDGNTDPHRGISIHSDSTVTAIFKPYCYATITAGEGGRVQVTGGEYNKTTKQYRCTYGTELTVKADPDEDYRLNGWSDGGTGIMRTIVITSDTTIQANFVKSTTPLQQYVVRVLSDNTELGSVNNVSGTYYGGDQLTITATPTERAEFVQWSDGVKEATRMITVSQDTTLIASFTYKKITLTIHASEGGTVNDSTANGTYDYGTQVLIIATPNEHYRFVKWSDGVTSASRYVSMTDKIELTATFALEQYMVIFLNADSTYLESNTWTYGETPSCSKTPTKAATAEYTYTFKGWSPAIVPVTDNATYIAVFDSVRAGFTITWLNADGSLIDKTTVEYGQMPTHTDATKAATAEFTYTFKGWSPTIVAVTGDATYTAVFDSIINEYTITFKDEDGTVLSAKQWKYGELPTCDEPTKPEDAQYTYTFAGWNPEVVTVTGEATYTATYTATKKPEGLEDLMMDGNQSHKVYIDGQIYILRGGKIYTIQGQAIK